MTKFYMKTIEEYRDGLLVSIAISKKLTASLKQELNFINKRIDQECTARVISMVMFDELAGRVIEPWEVY